jgi:hypothetical protein
MDSNKVLIGFVVLLVGFLAFPIVAKKMRNPGAAVAVAATGQTTNGPSSSPASSASAPSDPKYSQPPLLNEQNLIGSNWQFSFQNYKVKLTFAAGGIAYATHPMAKALTGLDYIEGRWRIEYNKVFLNASAGGNEISEEFLVSGSKIYQVRKGKPLGELERF